MPDRYNRIRHPVSRARARARNRNRLFFLPLSLSFPILCALCASATLRDAPSFFRASLSVSESLLDSFLFFSFFLFLYLSSIIFPVFPLRPLAIFAR
jgi:hypothetical protein